MLLGNPLPLSEDPLRLAYVLATLFDMKPSDKQALLEENDLLKKLDTVGKDLHEFSLEAVKMFRGDAIKAGYTLQSRTGSKA